MMDEPFREKNEQDILREIEELTHEESYIYSLAGMLCKYLFASPDMLSEIDWKERLIANELSLVAGLMVKKEVDITIPSNGTVMSQIMRTNELLSALHHISTKPFYDELQEKIEKGDLSQIPDSGKTMVEPIFYGATGAYDFQLIEFAKVKYESDSIWLEKNGIHIDELAKIIARLKRIPEEKFNLLLASGEPPENLHEAVLDIFCFSSSDLNDFEAESVEALIDQFSLVPGEVSHSLDSLGKYNELDSHPIIRMGEDRFFLPIVFNLAQSLYESPFYWMSADERYKDEFFKHRGEVTEQIALSMLERVFGNENVYKNVKVISNKRVVVSEIDVLAFKGNKAVILQAKSKRLTEISKRGDEEGLISDFEKAIQEAYEQGLTCRKAVIDKQNIFISDVGEEIHVDEAINDAYIICLTSDNYPAVTVQTDRYLRRQDDDPFPVAFSIFDLDIITFYLNDPFEFLYYLRQRTSLSEYIKSSSEMSFLAFHLKKKLYREGDEVGWIEESIAQNIDSNFPVMRGHQVSTEAVEQLHHKWINEKFQEIISDVKKAKNPRFTDAVFFLYDLTGEGADTLVKVIEETKKKCKTDGQRHDLRIPSERSKSGIGYLCQSSTPRKLQDDILALGELQKYKTKANIWLALGSITESEHFVDFIAFNNEEWVEDERLEKLSYKLKGKGMNLKTRKKLGRNDPCLCGSGKKFKKCCGR